jgi:hypothetical protein
MIRASIPPYSYRVSWSEHDGECVATCEEIAGLSGLAPTPAHAIQELRVAIAAWLDYLAAHGVAPPPAHGRPTVHRM